MARPHLHPELEFNLLVSGVVGYETARGTVALPLGRLVVFWGGYPHRMIGSGPLEMIGATLPLSDTNSRAALDGAAQALLSGQWMIGCADDGPADARLLLRLNDDLCGRRNAATAEICLLEITARLARLGAGCTPEPAMCGPSAAAERLLTVIARHYDEPVSLATLAARASVHPTYAAKIFSQTFGMPMWRYIENLRVAHAQRLLRATDWPVDRIAHEIGYRSRSGFYRAFTASVGLSPSTYRRR